MLLPVRDGRRVPCRRFDPMVGEMVAAGELEVAGSEHFGFEGGMGAMRADPLDSTTDFDHPGGEPSGHMETVEDVGGMT